MLEDPVNELERKLRNARLGLQVDAPTPVPDAVRPSTSAALSSEQAAEELERKAAELRLEDELLREEPQESTQTSGSAPEPSSSPKNSAMMVDPDETQVLKPMATSTPAQNWRNSTGTRLTVLKPSKPAPQPDTQMCRDIRITSGEYIMTPDGQMLKNPDWNPTPAQASIMAHSTERERARSKSRVRFSEQQREKEPKKPLSTFGETEVKIDYDLIKLVENPPLKEDASPYQDFFADLHSNMRNFQEYGDVRFSHSLKNAQAMKLRYYAKEIVDPGSYLMINSEGKPVAYVTVTCSPYYFGRSEFNKVWSQYNPQNYSTVIETLDVRPGQLAMSRTVIALSWPPTEGEYRFLRTPHRAGREPIPVIFREVRKKFGNSVSIRYSRPTPKN
jgi:hypothetical protein